MCGLTDAWLQVAHPGLGGEPLAVAATEPGRRIVAQTKAHGVTDVAGAVRGTPVPVRPGRPGSVHRGYKHGEMNLSKNTSS